jgi:hypothetical protein
VDEGTWTSDSGDETGLIFLTSSWQTMQVCKEAFDVALTRRNRELRRVETGDAGKLQHHVKSGEFRVNSSLPFSKPSASGRQAPSCSSTRVWTIPTIQSQPPKSSTETISLSNLTFDPPES